jgi:hypothetical protein
MTTRTNKPNNATALANDQKIQAGITKYFGGMATLSPKGNATTPAKLLAIFQDDITQTTTLETLLGQVAEQRAKQRAARALAIATRSDIKAYIIGNYGDTAATMLSDFGMPQKTPAKPDTATKAAAVQQAKATRVARGTKGPKQKAKVKGVVAPAAAATSAPAAVASGTSVTK